MPLKNFKLSGLLPITLVELSNLSTRGMTPLTLMVMAAIEEQIEIGWHNTMLGQLSI